MTTKTIKIGDLTIKELIKMNCSSCETCPFKNYEKDYLSDRLCDLVTTHDEYHILDQEIEVKYESKD